ncbi:lytic transglycosylase domain-containing protein [Erythrobacter sp. F6033]|uniref:lytic transglycosylase domain-containing protein n=1 Tax=Erythrobacter sp. F6033 TaxID=2926401 RepID=UPI001FF4718F|nr:lytic transglycosylase domain-containing protein [Erythrobacter sp. F6033]MCK0128230.1 lytic transglycosylase domain-containing protein [Erythrobacter sp. F6033]
MVGREMTMKMLRSGMIAIGLASATLTSGTAIAQSQSMAAHYGGDASQGDSIPTVLSDKERKHFAALFAALDRQDWNEVRERLQKNRSSVLYQTALAEFYVHANSPQVSAGQIADWFALGTHLPQSEQLGRLGVRRGLSSIPSFPRAQSFSRQPYAPKRIRPRSVVDGSLPSSTRSSILNAIKNDDPAGAHAILMEVDGQLSSAARAEWRQKVAWSYYIENNDTAALQLAETVSEGSGAWVAEGEWVAGLAAWRLGYCALAGEAFASAAVKSTNVELTAASHYWAHRSLVRCREPGQAQGHLEAAAQYDETLYGMLASDQLGIEFARSATPQPFTENDWRSIADTYNVQVAAALVEIGRPALADEVLRHQARVGDPSDFEALSRFARELGMPSTQLFMAHNAPRGQRSDMSLRFPVARWQPRNGWRVDPSLAFAHALQESNFRAGAVSPANARGLMQIMPGTARDHNRSLNLGASYADLNDPEVNLAYGQQHLEMLRDSSATQGKLPKIMAAYNAGLTPITRWNYEINDQNDPLLWMESIPYWETRGYVAIVMRNYWMYERAAGVESPSRRALAQGQWPSFPQPVRTRSAYLDR